MQGVTNNPKPVPKMELGQHVRIKVKENIQGNAPAKTIDGYVFFMNDSYVSIKCKNKPDSVLKNDFICGRAVLV